jgi:hypothetical protein
MKLWAALTALALAASFSAIATAQSASIDRGALVLVKDAQNRLCVSSVVAVSGDVVAISSGRVAVNGMPISIDISGATQWGPRQLASGQFFVAGDPLQLGPIASAWGLIESGSVVGTLQPRGR